MKKLAIALAVMSMLLSACGKNGVDDSTKELLIGKAEEVVTLLNEEDFDELRTMLDEPMKEELTVEFLQETADIVKESGSFISFETGSVSMREQYFVAVLPVEYSEDRRVYTVTFNEQQQVAGFFVK